jgi:hypothetical protein
MLRVTTLSDPILSVMLRTFFMLSDQILSVILPSVIMLSALLSVTMLSDLYQASICWVTLY